VRGARILPEVVDETQGYGSETGGGTRAITAGLRVVTSRDGAILGAEERLPQPPQNTTALPERLGGGFLFVLGTTVWRADHWLQPARPIFTSGQAVTGIVPGLDRVYLRSQNTYVAIDGRTGKPLDLGPWPQTPFVSAFAAADGWRAAAIADLRGVVATFDAGATWRTIDLPVEPRTVVASGSSLVVGGADGARNTLWFEIRGDGSLARLAGPPREARAARAPTPVASIRMYPGPPGLTVPSPRPAPPPPAPDGAEPAREDAPESTRIFGKRPLAAAIEDGWPLTDGTAIVARDGSLGRIRLEDGAVLEVAHAAFPLKPSRCHPVSMTRPSAVGAFGFVCGEVRGPTFVYAYDPLRGRLAELKRFDRPRVITSSGNGAIVVRGPCAEDGDPSGTPREPTRIEMSRDGGTDGGADAGRGASAGAVGGAGARAADGDAGAAASASSEATTKSEAEVHPFCVLGHDNTWREVHVRGDVGGERVVVLADGRIAVVSPPQGQTGVGRLTILDKGRATTLPVTLPRVSADVARVLRLGVWLDGFEERRPGVLGGWIDGGGVMLGIEIALDGAATPGQFLRDAGMPFVSGRYGLGWTAARRGFETVDGGMTWTSVDLPEPLVALGKVERRACGPIGCVAAGWMRVGWGEAKRPPPPAAPAAYRPTVAMSAPSLALTCDPLDTAFTPPVARATAPVVKPEPTPRSLGLGGISSLGGRSSVLSLAPGATTMPPFFAQPAPSLRESERGLPIEVQELPEHYPRLGLLGRLYSWGPKTGDWETQGRWQVRWLSPFAGWPEARASLPIPIPQAMLDFSKMSGGFGGYGAISSYGASFFQIATGDDSAHALLLARRITRTEQVPFELEADRAPLEIRRADGEPFGEIESVLRAGGRWFIATSTPAQASNPVTTVWQVEGAVARELARIPRAPLDLGRAAGSKLARREGGRSIGLVVDGQATLERAMATRWVLPIDLESGQLGEPEWLGYTDLAGRTLEACTDDFAGWVLDSALGSSQVRLGLPGGPGSLHSAYARLRLTPSRTCVERVAGMYDGPEERLVGRTGGPRGPTPAAPRRGEILTAATHQQARFGLRCTIAKAGSAASGTGRFDSIR